MATNPKAFVSYSWESEDHKTWIGDLAARLRRDSVDTILDRWRTVPGDQLPRFMEESARDSDFVLVVCTPHYKERSDKRKGGVGYEGDICTGEILVKGNNRKFIPLLRTGPWEEAAPTWMLAKRHIDFRGDPYSESSYKELLDTLLGRLESEPPLGPTPSATTDYPVMGIRDEVGARLLPGRLDWMRPETEFHDHAITLLELDDKTVLRLFLEKAPREAAELARRDDALASLATFLDRLACLAGIFVRFEDQNRLDATLRVLLQIYQDAEALLDDFPGPPARAVEVWLLLLRRIYALGALGVRLRNAPAIHQLASQGPAGVRTDRFNTMIRHGIAMGARARVLKERCPDLLRLAETYTRENEMVRPDLEPADARVLDSLCQFDLLWNLIAIVENPDQRAQMFYPHFAFFEPHRAAPAIDWLLSDTSARRAILPCDDQFLANAFRELARVSREQAFLNGWDGFESRPLSMFLSQHPANSPG